MPRRVPSAACWYPPTMSYQACGVLGCGAPSPPLRIEPTTAAAEAPGSIEPFSTCVIWPIFSARVIRPSSAATRSATGRLVSSHGRDEAAGEAGDGDPGPPEAEAPGGPGVTVAEELPQAARMKTRTPTWMRAREE